MKKQQKEQIKKDGQMSRAMYQQFLTAAPWWNTRIKEDERDEILVFLNEVYSQECKLVHLLCDEHSYLREWQPDSPRRGRALSEATTRGLRLTSILRLIHSLERVRGESTPDLSVYCRDN